MVSPVKSKMVFVLALLFLASCGQEDSRQYAQGVHDDEIVLGTHQDLSGPIVATSTGMRDGMLMAIEEINEAGGIHGRRLRLVVEDTGYEPNRAVIATKKLLGRDKIFAMIGSMGSPTTAVSMPLVLRAGVLHLFPLTALESTYAPLHPLKFASNTPHRIAFAPLLKLIVEERRLTRPAILYQDDDFGYDIYKATKSILKEKYGIDYAAVTTYKRGATEFSTQIARLKAANPDFLVLGTITRETVAAARAAQELGWDIPIICSIGCWGVEVPELGGNAVEGIYSSARTPMPHREHENPKMRAWFMRYEKRFGYRPNVQSGEGYSYVRFLAEALRRAGSNPTQMNVARALEDMPPWSDPDLKDAPLDFQRNNHQGSNRVHVGQIQNGRWRIISESSDSP